MKKFLKASLALALCATVTAGSYAAVTFDGDNAFVGKGDVQIAFGWNNATLQAKASDVGFYYQESSSSDYIVVCEWTTGQKNPTTHTLTRTLTTMSTVNAAVETETRKGGVQQVTGFLLTKGVSTPVSSGDEIPEVGEACPEGGGSGKVVISVDEDLESLTETASLYVTAPGELAASVSTLSW